MQTSTSRHFASSAKYNLAVEASNTKFTPRRPYVLNMKMPAEEEPVEEGATVVSADRRIRCNSTGMLTAMLNIMSHISLPSPYLQLSL